MDLIGDHVVIGPPGCGKTTFLGKQVNKLISEGKKPVVMSLTNTAANEVKGRQLDLPKENIGTLHSLAYRALDSPPLVDKTAWNKQYPYWPMTPDKRPDFDDVVKSRLSKRGDNLLGEWDLMTHRMTDKDLAPQDVAIFGERWEQFKRETASISFTDMISHAYQGGAFPAVEFDHVIGDEVQDFSKLEYRLLRLWCRDTQASILVGDPWQALYGWRGGDANAVFADPEIDDDRKKVLSQSYRVPVASHRASRELLRANLSDFDPSIQYLPTSEPGAVQGFSATCRHASSIIDLANHSTARGESSRIMASCNYMIDGVVKGLRKQGIPFANPWRPRQGYWNPLGGFGPTNMAKAISIIHRLNAAGPDSGRPWTIQEFWDWVRFCKADLFFPRGSKKALENMVGQDDLKHRNWMDDLFAQHINMEPIYDLLRLLSEGKTKEANKWLQDKLLGSSLDASVYPMAVMDRQGIAALREPPKIYVGTIHSFKGAEADNVILAPDLSYNAFQAWESDPRGRDEVARAFYVALTRAKLNTYILDADGTMFVEDLDYYTQGRVAI